MSSNGSSGCAGPADGGADHAVRLAAEGMAPDRMQRHAETAGAGERADALVEEVVDLPPPLTGGGDASALGQRRAGLRPA
ncbi:hypothetical protein GCM10010358_24060 [Streptomyces minutiscleroticus]|uniref:Uncharacterized protein n=1 Tax=Streptomyces minutiscleroticus TaxID=68238 RepID=A0A918NHZ4_9ACTN|nr:hypothetical protein GCM10010358_24060 [Streptomyces minutiscleroticus]